MRPVTARRPLPVWAGLLLGLVVVGARAQEPPRLLDVEVSARDDQLVCRVTSTGLPGQKARLSMQSGLVASLDLLLALMNERQEILADREVTLRLAFDLWEEFYTVEEAGQVQRFTDTQQLAGFLARLPAYPVAACSLMAPPARYRVRAQLFVHPIAPEQRERLDEVIAGEEPAGPVGVDDGQEVAIGLGELIRFLYKGGGGASPPESEASSPWFTVEELPDGQD